MPRASIKDKLAERNNVVKLAKYDTKYGWYYVEISKGKVRIVETDEPNLDNLSKDTFGVTLPNAIALSSKDSFLLTASGEPLKDDKPTVYIKNKPCYGDCLIVYLIDKELPTNIQPMTFSLAIAAIEHLQFIKGKLPTIEVVSLNN